MLWTSMPGRYSGKPTLKRRRYVPVHDNITVDDIELFQDVMVTLFGEKWERQEHTMGLSHQHITPQELYGLKAIVMFIHALPITRKSVPSLIGNAVELIKDIRSIVETHKDDSPDKCVTGKPLLQWSGKCGKKVKEKVGVIILHSNGTRKDYVQKIGVLSPK